MKNVLQMKSTISPAIYPTDLKFEIRTQINEYFNATRTQFFTTAVEKTKNSNWHKLSVPFKMA